MRNGQLWTTKEVLQLRELKRAGKSDADIAHELGRSPKAVRVKWAERENKIGSAGHSSRRYEKIKGYVPQSALEEREYAMGIGHRDMTAEFMGDPLPGRSALERK